MSPFPLLRLPSNELSKVLRHMNPIAQLGISLLSDSENSKKLISSLKIFNREIFINVRNYVHIALNTHNFTFSFTCGKTDGNVEIKVALFRRIEDVENNEASWSMPGMSTRQWIDHFLELSNIDRIESVSIHDHDERIDMNDFPRSLTGLHISRLLVDASYNPDIESIALLPTIDKLYFYDNSFYGRNFQRIIMQSYEELTALETGTRIKLNDILAANVSFPIFTNVILPDAHLNLFIKHWVAGSNHRLDGILLVKNQNEPEFNEAAIFNGVNYQSAVEREAHPEFRNRGFRVRHQTRAFDVTSNNGTLATVYLDVGMGDFIRDDIFPAGWCCMVFWNYFLEFMDNVMYSKSVSYKTSFHVFE